MSITAAPYPMKLKDKEFKAYPLKEREHEEFDNWCRREYLDRVRETTDDPDVIRVALQEIQDMHWFDDSGRVVAYTVRGLHKLASLMCRDQEVPYDLIKSPDSITEISSVFMKLHGTGSSPENGRKGSKKKGKSGN